jgi:hypothetical protein
MFKMILAVFFLFLTACAASSNREIFTPSSPNDGQSAVYIYRPSVMANALYSPDLYINEELKFPVKNGKKTRFTLAPGKYTFKLDANDEQGRITTLSLSLQPEITYYLRVTTTLKIKSAANYEPYQRSYMLENITREKARIEITDCCVNSDKKPIADMETETTNKPDDDGFSVDKTQNPFSH